MKQLFACFMFLATLCSGANSAAQAFSETSLSIGIHRIEAEIAATEETRARGLMFRERMEANHGMLFVFPEPARQCMWMKNTLILLSVAFLDGQGRIINIEEMEPRTRNNHCSSGPASYALEMNRNWFRQRGFAPGSQVRGLDQLPLPR
jgi:uncharacterized membrane protein (UPF0127 family)